MISTTQKRTQGLSVFAALALAGVALGSAAPANAQIQNGDNLGVQFEATGFGVYGGPSTVTYTNPGISITDVPGLTPSDAFTIDFTQTSIVVTVAQNVTFANGLVFNGMVITDNLPHFSSATLTSSTLNGFAAGDFSATANRIALNFVGDAYSPGQTLTISLGAVAPEPGTIALLLAGTPAIGIVVRRKIKRGV